MSIRRTSTSVAGVLAICGAVTAAQAPQTPAVDQKAPDSAVITVAGCVQKESAVLKRNPAAADIGMGDEFVLTFAALTAAGEAPKPDVQAPPEAVGTSGTPGDFGKVYRVTGDKENELKGFVGQRVQITGSFKNKEDAADKLSSIGTSGRTELTPANTPEITIATITPMSGTCAPIK